MKLATARIRWFADGGYAAAVADPERRRFTLVEGGARAARVVHVDGDAWAEARHRPVAVAGGVATTEALVAFDGRELRREAAVSYPDGTRREDVARAGGGKPERTTHWRFGGGAGAEARWSSARERELTFSDADGVTTRVLHTTYGEDGSRQTDISGPDGSPLGSTFSSPAPGGAQGTAYDADGSETGSWLSGTAPDGSRTVAHTEPDGTLEYWSLSGPSPSGSRLDHGVIHPDGSGSSDSSTVLVSGDGSTVTVSQSTTRDAEGHWTETTGVRDDDSGASQELSWGVGADGVPFRSSRAADGQGSESLTTVYEFGDGSFIISTTSKGSDGSVSTTPPKAYGPDGNEVDSSSASQAAAALKAKQEKEQQEEQEQEEQEEQEDEEAGGQPSGGGSGSFPSDEGDDEGPPLGPGTFAESILGPLFGAGGGGPTGEGGEADETARIDAVRGRLVSEALAGGSGEAGWGDSGADESPRQPVFDQDLAAPLIANSEDWGDLNNPRALVAVVARTAGARAGAAARAAAALLGG